MEAISVTHKRLGQRIKQLRDERDMTQEDLAFEAGVDRSYMGFIERGERNVTLSRLISICRKMKISLSELFMGL